MQIKFLPGNNFRSRLKQGLPSTALTLALLAPVGHVAQAATQSQSLPTASLNTPEVALRNRQQPRIQVAIALDTSNSMDGLLEQTRNQLWQVINEFSGARQDGVEPLLEIALFEYGNDGNSASDGYARKISGFTRELDAISDGLFGLTTNGGSEFCGYAIRSLVNDLQWSQAESDIRTIFIAGNESFAQGPISYRAAAALAKRHGISINTIHAGGHEQGIGDQWRDGAILAGGDYMSIDADQQVVHMVAPQDEKIAELNARLNKTYVPYGDAGAASAERQLEQDSLNSDISAGLLAKRAASKSSAFYRNTGWDLVDALDEGAIDSATIAEMEAESLPEPMRALTSQERVDYVREKTRQRNAIQRQILELSESRAAYVAEQKRDLAAAAPSVSDALTNAIKKQAREKNFTFEN